MPHHDRHEHDPGGRPLSPQSDDIDRGKPGNDKSQFPQSSQGLLGPGPLCRARPFYDGNGKAGRLRAPRSLFFRAGRGPCPCHVPDGHPGEKNFLAARMDWMDENIFGECLVNSNQQEIELNSVSIYPNPFSSFLIAQSEKTTNDKVLIIYDVQGKEIMRKPYHNNLKIDTSGFAQGIYIIKNFFRQFRI